MSPAHASTKNIPVSCAQYPVAWYNVQSGATPDPRHWFIQCLQRSIALVEGGSVHGRGPSPGYTPPDVPPVVSASDCHAVVAR